MRVPGPSRGANLAALREPKLLGGEGREAEERRESVEASRRQWAELPAPHLDPIAQIEQEAAAQIATVEKRRDEELSLLDRLIERTKASAAEVNRRAARAARWPGRS